MKLIKRDKRKIFFVMIFVGIIMRFSVATIGHNLDFDSYCIVGEIAGHFRNVYAETYRYNYAPVFLCIQGVLYRIAQISLNNWMLLYRGLIIATLTAADLGITAFLAKKYSYTTAIIFFINPVSIIITGYHNQFDNIAVLFALMSTRFFNDEKKLNKKDIGFVAFFSLSLLTKHILFIFPIFILFMKKLPLKKKALYMIVPPVIFLMSFIPFALSSNEAYQGIINNVFKYRSFNNAPIMHFLYEWIGFPQEERLFVYIIIMIGVAWIVRKNKFEHIMLIYFIAMVAFSSAIANQYLVIPMAALCVLSVWKWDVIYMTTTTIYLVLQVEGLGLLQKLNLQNTGTILDIYCDRIYGYVIAVWILFFALIHVLLINRKEDERITYGRRFQLVKRYKRNR